MDEEDERESLGAYENMERPDIRPNFAASALENSAVNLFRNSEESAKSTARGAANKVGEKVTEKVAEKGLDAATGGVGGKVLKAAEKSGATKSFASINPRANAKTKIKKALPLILIVAVVVGAISFMSTYTFGLFGYGFSMLMKRNSDTATLVNHKITDYQINNTQLGDNNGSSEYGDVIFNNASGFSSYQIQSFARVGLEYTESNGAKALAYNNADGSKTYVAADSAVSGTIYYGDEVIGEGGDEYVDAGTNDGKTEEERIADLKIALNVNEGSRIIKFSEALKDFNFRNKYIAATDSYRGGMGAWYSDTAKTTANLLGVSFNAWKNYDESPDNEKNKEVVIQTAAKISANDNTDVKSVAYDELAASVAEQSDSGGCGYDSAASVVGSIANAGETHKQVAAGALIMEAIDKMLAGEGSHSPVNAILNMVFEAGGTDTESMHHLYGASKLDQNSNDILSTSAQADLNSNVVNLSALSEGDQKEAETCMYVGNVNDHHHQGFIETIGSMFKSIGGWIKSKAKSLIDLFSEGTKDITGAVVSAVEPAVARFNQMKDNVYLSGHDNKLIGEAMVSSAELISNEMSKSVTGTMPGDTGAVKTAYRVQQEVIAEKAEYDRTTMSPFDPTSDNTFLGKIAYSLIPFATSNTALSLTSTVSKLGSILSNAATSLLPTSNAVSEAELQISQGDCVYANSVAAFSNARCNNYQTFNVSALMNTPTEIFNRVAEIRKNEGGYVYGISKSELEPDYYTDYNREEGHVGGDDYKDGTGRDYDDPDYGNGPLNPTESSMSSYWGTGGKEGTGTPHGCESDWQYQILYRRDANGNLILDANKQPIPYRYYNFDLPTEWKYSHLTNFEYVGYKTGYHNRTSATDVGREDAKNDEDPGTCQLDLKTDRQKQPVININSALGMFLLLSGQRTSDYGIADAGNVTKLSQIDFIHGRLHPCYIKGGRGTFLCSQFIDEEYGWDSNEKDVKESPYLSRLIGGSAYVNYTGDTDSMKKGYESNEIFIDPTTGTYFTNETKLYTAYISLIEWMEANNMLTRAADSVALEKYYDENPLDNSYAGILARYSGYSKDTVIAVLNLVDYAEWLANYDPSDLYPLAPIEDEVILYDNPEIIADIEPVIDNDEIVYDELRNRTVAV